jgi:hypothetical protein
MLAFHPVFHCFDMGALPGGGGPHPSGLFGAQRAAFDM